MPFSTVTWENNRIALNGACLNSNILFLNHLYLLFEQWIAIYILENLKSSEAYTDFISNLEISDDFAWMFADIFKERVLRM